MARSESVDDYLAGLAPERRERIEALRRIVREVVPEAEEAISYNMPAFRLDGRFFVSFDAFKHHDSIFPASEGVVTGLGDQIRPYLAGRGTIRFPIGRELPLDLIRRIVAIRAEEHHAHRRSGGPHPRGAPTARRRSRRGSPGRKRYRAGTSCRWLGTWHRR